VVASALPVEAAASDAYARGAAELALGLASDVEEGLSENEAAQRLAAVGANVIARDEGGRYLRIAARQLADPLVGLLVAAAVVSAAIGEQLEAVVIAAIVVLNGVLGFVQEAGAERALAALRRAVTIMAAVIRGGRERSVEAAELVPGDVIVLRDGDRVPADARLVAAERLAVDESALTGESVAVDKHSHAVAVTTPLAERSSMVFAAPA
jgi:magnesium-transporting ATPase (P-type)